MRPLRGIIWSGVLRGQKADSFGLNGLRVGVHFASTLIRAFIGPSRCPLSRLAAGRNWTHLDPMIPWRDVMALGVAAVATAGLGALVIMPNVYPAREPLGYLAGTALSYEFRVGKLGARGLLEVQLDRGEVLRVRSSGDVVPGDRVCVRAVQRGEVIEGTLAAMNHCPPA